MNQQPVRSLEFENLPLVEAAVRTSLGVPNDLTYALVGSLPWMPPNTNVGRPASPNTCNSSGVPLMDRPSSTMRSRGEATRARRILDANGRGAASCTAGSEAGTNIFARARLAQPLRPSTRNPITERAQTAARVLRASILKSPDIRVPASSTVARMVYRDRRH